MCFLGWIEYCQDSLQSWCLFKWAVIKPMLICVLGVGDYTTELHRVYKKLAMNQSGFYGMSAKGFEGSSNDICFWCVLCFQFDKRGLSFFFWVTHPYVSPKSWLFWFYYNFWRFLSYLIPSMYIYLHFICLMCMVNGRQIYQLHGSYGYRILLMLFFKAIW